MADRKQELDCGCVLALDYDKNMMIVYCPKHKAAHDLYKACKLILERDKEYGCNISLFEIEEAVAKAKGK